MERERERERERWIDRSHEPRNNVSYSLVSRLVPDEIMSVTVSSYQQACGTQQVQCSSRAQHMCKLWFASNFLRNPKP